MFCVTKYTHDDCEEYKNNMTPEEAIERLEAIEGEWMGSRPSAAYSKNELCDEWEFSRFKALAAIDYAVAVLKELRGKKGDIPVK